MPRGFDESKVDRGSFPVVCYDSNEGDVGCYLNVKGFLDAKNPVTDE